MSLIDRHSIGVTRETLHQLSQPDPLDCESASGASKVLQRLREERRGQRFRSDFVWSRARTAIGIEVKASERWRPEFARALNELHANGAIRRAYGVYLGDRPLRDGVERVLPVSAFLRELASGRVLTTTRHVQGFVTSSP